MEDKELELITEQILDSLEHVEQRLGRIEEKLEKMEEEKSFGTTLPQDDFDPTRKISEELVDNLKVEDIPANNFTLENNDNIIDFSSFAALKRTDNLVSDFELANDSLQREIAERMVDEMEKGTIDITGEFLNNDFVVSNKRRMGFTSTHLILLISSLSSIILFILGIFFIVGI